jgi:hypothetical protein
MQETLQDMNEKWTDAFNTFKTKFETDLLQLMKSKFAIKVTQPV